MNNNTIEDYVSFEVAKLLKEKEFNAYCNWYYDANKDPQLSYCSNSTLSSTVRVARPTHALAIKWIRENGFTDIWVEPFFSKDPKVYIPQIWHRGEFIDSVPPQESFFLANEAALLYTLQNLIP